MDIYSASILCFFFTIAWSKMINFIFILIIFVVCLFFVFFKCFSSSNTLHLITMRVIFWSSICNRTRSQFSIKKIGTYTYLNRSAYQLIAGGKISILLLQFLFLLLLLLDVVNKPISCYLMIYTSKPNWF